MPTPAAPTFNSLLANPNPAGVGSAPQTNTTTPVNTQLNALSATNTPPQAPPGGKTVPVVTPNTAVSHYNQTLSKVNTLQQQAQTKAPVYPAGNIAAAQQLNAKPVQQQAVVTTPTTTTTGNANTDQSIAAINNTAIPTAPTNLTDSFGNPLTVPAGLTGADETNYIQTYNQNQQQYQTALTQIGTVLGQIASGTYYTAAQQNQIASTQQLFQNTATLLDAANQASTKADITLGLRSGESMSTIANQAKDETMQLAFQLSNNTAKMTQTVAALQEAFEKDNLDAVQAESKNLTDAYTAQTDFLNKMITTAQDAQDKVNTYNLQLAKDVSDAQNTQFQDAMASATLSLTQKKDAFDEYVQQATLTETQRHDAADEYNQSVANGIEQQKVDLQKQQIAFSEGQISYGTLQGAQANIPGVIADGTLGITYFDPSSGAVSGLSDTLKQAVTLMANNSKVPTPNDVANITDIQSASKIMGQLQNVVSVLQSGGKGSDVGNDIAGIKASLAAMKSPGFQKVANDLPTMLGGYIHEPYSLQQLAAKTQQDLTNAVGSLVPLQYNTTQSFLSDNPLVGNAAYNKAKAFALSKDPTATGSNLDSDILYLINNPST